MAKPTRRAILGAIACTPAFAVSCAPQSVAASAIPNEWSQRLTHYEQRKMLYDADCRFGRYFRAMEKYNWMRGDLLKRYGTLEDAKLDTGVAAEWQKVWDEMSAAETANAELYFYPMDEADKALINTPAPDVRAIEIKLEVLVRCAIDEGEMDIMPIIVADVSRLAGEA